MNNNSNNVGLNLDGLTPARILDKSGNLLMSGHGEVYGETKGICFFPDVPAIPDPNFDVVMKIGDRTIEVSDLEKCRHSLTDHYHGRIAADASN